jgi:hypothetical protein
MANKKPTKLDTIAEEYPEAVKMDGFDDCILGICNQFGRPAVIAYDQKKVIKELMKDGMSWEEAEEYFSFNQIGAYVGDHTPVFILADL